MSQRSLIDGMSNGIFHTFLIAMDAMRHMICGISAFPLTIAFYAYFWASVSLYLTAIHSALFNNVYVLQVS